MTGSALPGASTPLRRRRWVVGGAVVALMLASGAAFRVVHAVEARPNLAIPGRMNEIVFSVPGYMYPKYVAGGGPMVCLDEPGRIHVDSIAAMRGTLKIHAFTLIALKGSPLKPRTGTGDRIGTIASSRLMPNPKFLTIPCKAQHPYELLLEMWATPETARGEGLVVHYTRGNGSTDVLEIPSYTLVMCARKGDPNC